MNASSKRPIPPPEPSLETLDRLEELLELMDELGVSTREEAAAMLASLEAAFDDDDTCE